MKRQKKGVACTATPTDLPGEAGRPNPQISTSSKLVNWLAIANRIRRAAPLECYAGVLLLEHGNVLHPVADDPARFIGRCCFHRDEGESFFVDSALGQFGCVAPECRAHEGGDVIRLHELRRGLDTVGAIIDLATDLML